MVVPDARRLPGMFLGLRTIIYPAPDLDALKRWYTRVLGIEPYFDQPFYVGFNVGGYELALDPDGDVAAGPRTYWGVGDADAALQLLVGAGAAIDEDVRDVGDGIRVATVRDPAGSVVGIIENPHFAIVEAHPGSGPGK
jgi:catechol 2,3-dioxygenase-like lactoylglutathione lyase family enzyme